MLDPGLSSSTSEVDNQKSTSHAPDLLDGPDIDEEGAYSNARNTYNLYWVWHMTLF